MCSKLTLNHINQGALKRMPPLPCVSQAQVEAKKEHEGAVHLLEVSRGPWGSGGVGSGGRVGGV